MKKSAEQKCEKTETYFNRVVEKDAQVCTPECLTFETAENLVDPKVNND